MAGGILTIVVFFGLNLHIVERGQSLKNPKTGIFGQFLEPASSLWCIINSIITIGYGDTIPQTYYGRIITMTAIIIGILFSQIITVKLAKRLYQLKSYE
jgi:voltage-gated potassium channel